MTKEEVIRRFDLKPLPGEGGYYNPSYTSVARLPACPGKPVSTAMYYLLFPETCSCLHRLPTDEVYHFYLGDPVRLMLISPEGRVQFVRLGQQVEQGMEVQFVVPAGWWQGSFLEEGGQWALMGTTMAPGYTADDFTAADRQELLVQYPAFSVEIIRLTCE